jgi:hypothetical protein
VQKQNVLPLFLQSKFTEYCDLNITNDVKISCVSVWRAHFGRDYEPVAT